MNLKDLGEFGLIDRITKGIKIDRSVIVGVGDDAAVLEFGKKEYLLLTCDMLVEDVDFKIDYAEPRQIGWKAVCCSVSDIAAMAGVPKWMVISLGFSKRLGINAIDGITRGVKKAAAKFMVNIVGGDISRSEKLVIDVTMLGTVVKRNLIKRSGAKPGDAIFVTGTLGGAVKLGKHLNFTPRIRESQILAENFKINSMIDISDGLSSDLRHILKMSKVGAVIYEKFLPKTRGASLIDALSEGEDFELLFTAPKKEALRLLEKFPLLCKTPLTCIGEIIKGSFGFILVDKAGKARQVRPKGYDHFATAKTQNV